MVETVDKKKPLAALFARLRQEMSARGEAPLYVAHRTGGRTIVRHDHTAMLHILQTDDRMAAAWKALRKSVSDTEVVQILRSIMDVRWRSDHNPEIDTIKSEHKEKFDGLISSADLLLKYINEEGAQTKNYSSFRGTDIPDRLATSSEVLSFLGWFLREIQRVQEIALVDRMPASQKRDRANAFAVLLCREMVRLVGHPHYEFVATVKAVIFGGEITVEAVRKIYERDKGIARSA